jgi:fused signal recognition particle receptor
MFGFLKNTVLEGYKKIKECLGLDKTDFDKALIEKTLLEQNFMPQLVKKLIEKIEQDERPWQESLRAFLLHIFPAELSFDLSSNNVFVLLGINGSGKTTSSIKLARMNGYNKKKTIVIPADTFRAAAKDQLKELASDYSIDFFDHEYDNPSTVIFKAAEHCKQNQYEKIIIDTAGRIHQNEALMRELVKSVQTVKKQFQGMKILNLLVLDGLQGKNLLEQATLFKNHIHLDGIILTKLDAQIKPGILFSIVDLLQLPIVYIGVGQKESDLVLFNRDEFIGMFFSE